ncbi:MAG TPA: hypothetical protein VGE67_13840, partial [Haloferula sp.]
MKRSLALLFLTTLCSGHAWADLSVSKLRCEYLVDPIGIDEVEPRLSWVVASPERGEKQTAWQVLVASTPAALAANQGDLWDSGKVNGSATSQIEYAGSALASRAECHWKVRAWDKDGQPSAWSAPAKWSIGLLQNADWSAQWIDGATFGTADSGPPATILSATYEAVDGTGT